MNSPVIIKSFQNGIAVILDETLAFPQLSEEVGLKFRRSEEHTSELQSQR